MARGVVHLEIGGRDLEKRTVFHPELFGREPARLEEGNRLISPEDGLGGGLMRCGGAFAMFQDLEGNRIGLLQPAA